MRYDGFHIKKDYDEKWQVRFDYILWETSVEHAQDLDFVVSEWLQDGCPLRVSGTSNCEDHRNYASLREQDCCGMAAAPLVWCRVSAAVARL